MQFVMQLDLQAPLPVSDKFALAYLFICPHYENYRAGRLDEPCPTWDPAGGANALLLQAFASNEVVAAPAGVSEVAERAVDFVPYQSDDEGQSTGLIDTKLLELYIEAEPDTPPDAEDVEVTLPDHWRAPKTLLVGGDPQWLQDPEAPACPKCGGGMKLLAQLDAEVAESSFDDERYNLPFGDAGVGYLFACERECDPAAAAFLWQTT